MNERLQAGPVAALMDEYERAAAELAALVRGLTDEEFTLVRDPDAQDPDCLSIQTVMRHVVRSGYGYADYFRAAFNAESNRPAMEPASRDECLRSLADMLAYTEATLNGHWELSSEDNAAVVINTRWGQRYDFEQMFEHAIVHVLRHRRQIERWMRQG